MRRLGVADASCLLSPRRLSGGSPLDYNRWFQAADLLPLVSPALFDAALVSLHCALVLPSGDFPHVSAVHRPT